MPRMLIVDDEPDIGDCLGTFFGSRGFQVYWVSTGEEALEYVHDQPADVILLDIRLPDMWGLELLRRIKGLLPEVKIVMVTALNQPDLASEAKAYGACGYVTKPFDFSDLTWAPVFAESF